MMTPVTNIDAQGDAFQIDSYEDAVQFRSLAEAVPTIVWTANADGSLDYTNRRWHEYSGFSLKQSQGDGWVDAVLPEDLAISLPIWQHSIATGETYVTEFRLRAKSGKYRWHLARAVAVRDAHGTVVKWFGTTTDIDDQKRAEKLLEEKVNRRTEEMKKAHEELQQMSFLLSHEMQAPLLRMTNDLKTLKSRYESHLGEDADAFIEAASTCAESIQSMLDGLWMLARIDMSDNVRSDCNLNDIFKKAMSQLQPLVQTKRAQVVADQLPTVKANANQMEYMVQQLIENALKYCGSDTPEIIVKAKIRDEQVEISVKDNGDGFDMAHAGKIFKMFQRLDSDTPGIGLGLAVCKKIAEAHGGTMWATSAPLKGASFSFTIAR